MTTSVAPAAESTAAAAGRRRRDRLPEAALVVLATALAAGFVLYDLGAKSIWADEATTFGTTSQHGAALWHWALHDGGNMLGYYLAMHVWVRLFGTSLVSLRLPAALCFIASVPCVYFLMRHLCGRRAAAIAMLLQAVSFPLIYWGQQARAYAPAVLFLLLGAIGLVVALREGRTLGWVLFAVSSILAAYMLLLAGLVVIAQLVAALIGERGRGRRAPLVSAATIGVGCVPLLGIAAHQGRGQLSWIAPTLHSDLATLPPLLGASGNFAVTALGVAGTFALALVARDLWQGRSSSQAFVPAFLLGWILIPLVAMVVISETLQPVLEERYLLPILPGVSMILGAAGSRIRPRILIVAATIGALVLRIGPIATAYGVSIENWSAATNAVATALQPGDCLAFFVADGFTSFSYYLEREPAALHDKASSVLPASPVSSDLPYELDPATLSQARFAEDARSCPRLWLVQSDDSPISGPLSTYQALKNRNGEALDAEISTRYSASSSLSFPSTFPGRTIVIILYVSDASVVPRA